MSRQEVMQPVQQMQAATPTILPPPGSMKLYPKVDGLYYKLDPGGVETPVAAPYTLPDPLLVNNMTVYQTLTIGYSNGRLWDGGLDDPFTPGQRLVWLNAATVTPGATHAARLQVNGVAVVAGPLNSGPHTMPDANAIYWVDGSSTIHSSARSMYFDEWGVWSWRSTSNAYATRMHLDSLGNLTVYGATTVVGQITCQGTIVATGQVHCAHLYTTADVAGGKPVYMAGQIGDNFLRWFPAP